MWTINVGEDGRNCNIVSGNVNLCSYCGDSMEVLSDVQETELPYDPENPAYIPRNWKH